MANFYVATSFQNIPEACEVMTALRAAGHTITHDWTTCRVDPAWPPDRVNQYLQRCGVADFRGVTQADAVVFINHVECRDAMAELGIAVGRGIPVYVLHAERRPSVFFHRTIPCESLNHLLRLW